MRPVWTTVRQMRSIVASTVVGASIAIQAIAAAPSAPATQQTAAAPSAPITPSTVAAVPAPVAQPAATETCVAGSMCFELVKVAPATFITLILGTVAAWIAYRQSSIARAKLKLDLFEKRYGIFLETWKILSETVSKGTLEQSTGLGTPFNNLIPQAGFLFGSEIEAYLSEAASKWAQLRGLQSKSRRMPGMDGPDEIAKQTQLEQWFFQEADTNAKRLFGKYLSFKKWR